MGKPKQVDWEAVSREYRAGIRSLRNIGDEFGITEGAIRKRAKAEQWPRDLSEQIQAKAKDLVRKDLVRSGTIGTKERDVITNNAQAIAEIVLAHRKDAADLRLKAKQYRKELDDCGDDVHKRTSTLKMLAEIEQKIVVIERTAFDIKGGNVAEEDDVIRVELVAKR
jgi:hypothetical protein